MRIGNFVAFCIGCVIAVIILECVLQAGAFYVSRIVMKTHGFSGSSIVCIGDSNTFGIGASIPQNSYPALLQNRISEKTVINEGIPGSNSSQALLSLKKYENPRAVIVMTGVNNLWNTEMLNKKKKWYSVFKTPKLLALLVYRVFQKTGDVTVITPTIQNVKELSTEIIFKEPMDISFLKDDLMYEYAGIFNNLCCGNTARARMRAEKLLDFQKTMKTEYLYALTRFYGGSSREYEQAYVVFTEKYPDTPHAGMLSFCKEWKSGHMEESFSKLPDFNQWGKKAEDDIFIIGSLGLFLRTMGIKTADDQIYSKIPVRYNNLFTGIILKSIIAESRHQYEAIGKEMLDCEVIQEYTDRKNVKEVIASENSGDFYREYFKIKELLWTEGKSVSFDYVKSLAEQKDFDSVWDILRTMIVLSDKQQRVWAYAAYSLMQHGNISAAAKLMDKIEGFTSKTSDVQLLCAYIYEEKKEYEKALFHMQKAYEIMPDKNIAGEIIRFAGNIGEDTQKLREMYNVSDDSSVTDVSAIDALAEVTVKQCRKKAREYRNAGMYEKAVEVCERALKKYDGQILLIDIAKDYIALRNYNEALKTALQAYEQNLPESAGVLGMVYMEKKEYRIAEKWLQQALNKQYNREILEQYAECLARQGKINEIYELADRYSESVFVSMILRAQGYALEGRKEELNHILEEVSEIAAGNEEKLKILSFYFHFLPDRFQKKADLMAHLSGIPQYCMLNAEYFFQKNDSPAALFWLNKVIEKRPSDVDALNMFGRLIARTDPGEAFQKFRQAFHISGDFRRYFHYLDFVCTKEEIRNAVIDAKDFLQKKGLTAELQYSRSVLDMIDEHQDAYAVLKEDLYEMKRYAHHKNALFIVQTYPFQSYINDIIRKFAEETDSVLVDNALIFNECADSSFFIADGHCNDKGYALMAQNVLEVLKKYEIMDGTGKYH